MPGLAMDFSNGNRITNESSGDNSSYKDSCSQQLSPRSPLSPHSPHSDESIDLAIDNAIDTSIEQLYNNVCEMESSDQSPSRPSFISYGEESRIDSELCHLVGYYEAPEMMKQTPVQEKKDFANENSTKSINFQSKLSPRSVASLERPPSSKIGERNPRKLQTISSMRKQKKRVALRGGKLQNGAEDSFDVEELDGPEVGPLLLKQTRHMISSGENPRKALQLALRALKSYEKHADGKTNLDLVMCLHVLAAIYCKLGQYDEAIPILERSIEIPVIEDGPDHSLAKFAGCMQLGDTYAMLGQIENSILCYTAGLEIQRQVLGETDPRVGETSRYVAEAHVQALQFDEAEKLCQMALDIHKENGSLNSLEEAADRRLMGLICDSKGDYESALEHYAIASMSMSSSGQKADVASIDCNIGDAYLALARYDEAIWAYNKALAAFKPSKGENHPAVASVYARLADLYHKIGKFKEAKSCCEKALRIYTKPNPGTPLEEVANGLIDISAIYQSMDDLDRALKLIKKALKIYGNAPGQQATIAGIEAQMGVMYYMMGNYSDSYTTLKSSISKFRACAEKKSLLFGIALNQMGLACVQRYAINEAAGLFEEAREILEQEYGPYHPDTLGVCSNLAGTYDAMGRLDDAIEILEYVVGIREEKLGTANPDVDDEKRRLAELLKEAGRERNRKSRRLEMLLAHNSRIIRDGGIMV